MHGPEVRWRIFLLLHTRSYRTVQKRVYNVLRFSICPYFSYRPRPVAWLLIPLWTFDRRRGSRPAVGSVHRSSKWYPIGSGSHPSSRRTQPGALKILDEWKMTLELVGSRSCRFRGRGGRITRHWRRWSGRVRWRSFPPEPSATPAILGRRR
jgi:hypothetical protein